MKQRTIKETRRDRQVQREGWADLGKIDFQVKATGSLTFGQQAPCAEPLIRGSNILKDPGFEKHISVPQGPFGLTFPGDGLTAFSSSPGSLYWDTENITDRYWYNSQGWAVFSNNFSTSPFAPPSSPTPFLSQANPHSGQYHWRVTYEDLGPSWPWAAYEAYPIPVSGSYCDLLNGLIQGYSARVEPGDTVTMGIWAAVSNVANGPYYMDLEGSWYDEDANIVSDMSVVEQGPINDTAYHYYERSAVAPPGAYTAVVGYFVFEIDDVSGGTVHVDMDDAVLGVE